MVSLYVLIGVFLILLCAVAWFAWRSLCKKKLPSKLPQPTEFVIQSKQVELRGVRYARHGAPPLLLVHGYAGNSRNWREMGYALYERGFDIWMPNLRGHGQGTQRSQVHAPVASRYSFSRMVTEDYPILVEHVFAETGKPVTILAHSMGGIAARAYLSGVEKTGAGEWTVDEDRAKKIARERVRSLILIGSPVHFKRFPEVLRWIMNQPTQLLALMRRLSPVPITDKAPSVPGSSNILSRAGKVLWTGVHFTLGRKNIARGVVELKNFNPRKREFERLLEKGISKVPWDLFQDVNRWVQEGEIKTEDGFSFSKARRIFVPLLLVAGDLDQLAPYPDVFELARQYAPYTDIRTILVKHTSHVDLIAGERAASLLAPLFAKFINRPNEVGPAGSHIRLGRRHITALKGKIR